MSVRQAIFHLARDTGSSVAVAEAIEEHGADHPEYGLTPLHYAISLGCTAAVRLLIDHEADVELPDADGYGPLAHALHVGHLDIADLLLVHGASPHGKEGSKPPLHVTAEQGLTEVAQRLVAAGVELTVVGPDALVAAARHGQESFASWLLDAGVVPLDDGAALIAAVAGGKVTLVERLVAVCPQLIELDGARALLSASLKASPVLASTLLRHGARTANPKVLANAVERGHVEVAKTLVAAGLRPERTWTVLLFDHVWSKEASAPMVEWLLSMGAEADASNEHTTALHTAANKNAGAIVDLLLGAGASPDATDKHGKTPVDTARDRGQTAMVDRLLVVARLPLEVELIEAAAAGDVEVVERLLAQGTSPTAVVHNRRVIERARGGATVRALVKAGASPHGDALSFALIRADLEAAEVLVELGAAINRPGWDPLHAVAAAGSAEGVRWLLQAGATPDEPREDAYGEVCTPLYRACARGSAATVRSLLEAGAGPRTRTTGDHQDHGMTAIEAAVRGQHDEVVATLLAADSGLLEWAWDEGLPDDVRRAPAVEHFLRSR